MKRTVLMFACLAVMAMTPVSAFAVPVSRLDLFCEKTISALQLEDLNYVREVLTNLEDLEAIKDLRTLAADVSDLIEFKDGLEDLDDDIKDMSKSILKGVQLGKTTAEDLSDAVNTGKFDGKDLGGLLGDINGTVGEEGGNLNEVLVQSGIDGNAGGIAVERVFAALLAEYDLTPEQTGGSGSSDGKDEENVEDVVSKSLELAIETVPMSMPNSQRAVTDIVGSTNSTMYEKRVYSGNIADASRTYALSSITSAMAPYMLKEGKGSYREVINKIEEQSKKSLEKTTELSNGGPSQALRTIAALSAVQVEQSALQNQLLISMIDVMADEIKMMGINAMLNVEGYTQGMHENMLRYIEVQEQISAGD